MSTTIDLDKLPFIQAKHFIKKEKRDVRALVLHSMEAPEKGGTAEAVAKYFSTVTRKASAHYCIDNNSIVKCLRTSDIAAAAPGLNTVGVHLELAGYAKQSASEWRDEYSKAVIENAARLSALLCKQFNIPVRVLSLEEVSKIKSDSTIKGITTHRCGTFAFKVNGGHTDPGPNFPMELFVELVKFYGRSI